MTTTTCDQCGRVMPDYSDDHILLSPEDEVQAAQLERLKVIVPGPGPFDFCGSVCFRTWVQQRKAAKT